MREFYLIMCMIMIALFSIKATEAKSQGSLVLLVDVSSSVNDLNMQLQTQGYITALSEIQYLENVNIEVILFSRKYAHISSGSVQNAIAAFKSIGPDRANIIGETCLANAIRYVNTILPSLPQPVVVDISGDGEANCADGGRDISLIEAARLGDQGARINTLFIKTDPSHTGVSPQYLENVETFYAKLTKNNGFTIVADGFNDFVYALFQKLVMEIAFLVVYKDFFQYNSNFFNRNSFL